jgi:hypothetical protein
VNEKPRNLMMLIKHIKLFLPFLMDLFLLLILFSIAHMLHMLSFLSMMIPSMLSMMLLNTRLTIMLGNPIQVGSNHIVSVGDICVLCGCSINGSLALRRMCSTFLLSIDQAIDKGLHVVCDKSLLPYSC